MSEISKKGRTHDELHREHPGEYNRIVDLDHDIELIDAEYYRSSEEGYKTLPELVQRSLELRKLLDDQKMEEFEEKYKKLQSKVSSSRKI